MKTGLLFTALVLAGTSLAAGPQTRSFATATMSRDWRNQWSPMSASMTLWLTHRIRLPNGQYQDQGFTCWLRVDANVSMAQLRAGEEEHFDVQVYDSGMSGDDPMVDIQVRPRDGYYYYFPQQHNVVIRGSSAWDNLELYASSRQRSPAPATVDHMSVQFTTPTSPVTFSWRDYGAQDNPGSTAEYRFRVGRVLGGLDPDVVVAEGELGTATAVTLTRGGAFTQGHSEWFQQGQEYRLVIWMRRKNSDAYTEEYGLANWGTFEFQQGGAILQAPGLASVQLPRQRLFRALYGSHPLR